MTTYSESFNTADSTTLGPNQSWTEDAGDLQIVGNACRAVSANTRSWGRITAQTATDHKRAKVLVKTFNTPGANTNEIVVYPGMPGSGTQYGARITVNSSGTCQVCMVFGTGTGATSDLGTAQTITKPTAPFTFEYKMVFANGGPHQILVNDVIVFTNPGQSISGSSGAGFNILAQAVAEVEVDSFESGTDNMLPTLLTDFQWPADGCAYVGPFISSAGSVYVVNGDSSDATNAQVSLWKATDPTDSFTKVSSVDYGAAAAPTQTLQMTQQGDTLRGIMYATNGAYYFSCNLATDALSGSVLIDGSGAWVNASGSAAWRSNGDRILFCNAAGVVNMGKTYGRVAAYRLASGAGGAGAATAVGIGLAATTQQTESVDSVLPGSSDRVHLIWTKCSATASVASDIVGRCVKSSDNLDGTAPATAAYTLVSAGTVANVSPADAIHASGQGFMSSGNVLGVPYQNGTPVVALLTATDADSPTWSTTAVSAASPLLSAPYGKTARRVALGGAPYDGTNKTVAWVGASGNDPMYDKDTGSGFGTDATILAATTTQISANVFQRGSSIVLAVVYDVSSGVWVYDEVVLRTVSTTVMPVQPMIPVGAVQASATW